MWDIAGWYSLQMWDPQKLMGPEFKWSFFHTAQLIISQKQLCDTTLWNKQPLATPLHFNKILGVLKVWKKSPIPMGHDFPPAQLSFTEIPTTKNQTRKCLKVAAAQCTRRTIPENFYVQPNQQRCWRGRGETPFQKPVGYLQRSKNGHQKKLLPKDPIYQTIPSWVLSEEPCSPNVNLR